MLCCAWACGGRRRRFSGVGFSLGDLEVWLAVVVLLVMAGSTTENGGQKDGIYFS
jgi:hypothetical protein